MAKWVQSFRTRFSQGERLGLLVLGLLSGGLLVACESGKTPASADAPASAQAKPTQGQPMQGQPTQGQPTQGQPTQGQPTQGQPTQGEARQPKPAAGEPKLEERQYRFPAPERLVAIGDLHGDLSATKMAFRLAGAVGQDGHWSGGKLVVVQTGDQLDRGDDEREILEFLERLAEEAKQAGGALHVLNGNHESMNVLGDFRYVTPRGFRTFDDVTPKSPLADRYPSEWQARAGAFLPRGRYANFLAERDVIIVVGDTVFVHGGVRPPHVDHGVGRLNAESRAFMRGELSQPPRLVVDPEGPLWTRVYGEGPLDPTACAVLARALEKLQVKRMVVGHTVQKEGASSACDERVWRIDVGLSRYYGDGPIQVLEIKRDAAGVDHVRVLSAPRDAAAASPAKR
jgi:hypothetical protein